MVCGEILTSPGQVTADNFKIMECAYVSPEESKADQEGRLRKLGLVLIGRNEGARLRMCLESIPQKVGAVVYVDSGSSDGSVELAESRGVSVVNLDMTRPFTAARARNEGFEHLVEFHDALEVVQFVDGDCGVVEGWLEKSTELLEANRDWLAVCGWRRERFPENSIYNQWCDLEWTQAPIGDVGGLGFGGDVMIRIDAFREIGGYNADLIAGEDPDLSARLGTLEGRIVRVDETMTLHDADIRTVGQWWSRSLRSGHAYAEVSALHAKDGVFRRNMRSVVLWGGALPLVAIADLLTFGAASIFVVALYLLQIVRIARSLDPARFLLTHRLLWGVSCMVSQVPKLVGLLTYLRNRRTGVTQEIIEYK